MTAIGPGTGGLVVYDWDTDRFQTFRRYARAYNHAARLLNRGHYIEVWRETECGQEVLHRGRGPW